MGIDGDDAVRGQGGGYESDKHILQRVEYRWACVGSTFLRNISPAGDPHDINYCAVLLRDPASLSS